jgi:malonate-semialdehyde dehydrogenase (acetylating) / methylmalonate-semialdehyde dehydrogenase
MTADGTKTSIYRTPEAHRRGEVVRLANYVGGMWRAVDAVETLDDIDPATGEVAALVPLSRTRQVREAAEAARAAQPG